MITPRTALAVLLVTGLYRVTGLVGEGGWHTHGIVISPSSADENPSNTKSQSVKLGRTPYATFRGRPWLTSMIIASAGGLISKLTPERTATFFTTQSTSAIQEVPPLLISQWSSVEVPLRSSISIPYLRLTLSAAPNAECGECYLEAATSSGTSESAAGMTRFPLGLSRQANADITAVILTAFSITSAYLSNGFCITTSGGPVMLTEAHTITSPTIIPSSAFQAYVVSEFIDFLGSSACSGIGVKVLPTPPVTVEAVTSTSLPAGANSTTSPTLHSSNATKPIVTPQLEEPTKIGIGVGASSAALILVFLIALLWRKRRLRSAAINAGDQGNTENRQEKTPASQGDGQPYLQPKPELEAEEQQKHELEARQRIYELDGETGIKEIPAGTFEHRLAVMRSRQELRGGEHGQELDS